MGAWVETRVEDGVRVTEAAHGSVAVVEMRFPPAYVQGRFAPPNGYLAIVLDGALHKEFRNATHALTAGTAATIPAEATHAARFGDRGARVLVLKPSDAGGPYGELLRRVRVRRDPGLGALARRLAGELRAADSAAPLAVDGLALDVVTAAVRSSAQLSSTRPPWLSRTVEQLHCDRDVSVGELASTANVHPAHLARVFARHFGVSLGTYLRRLRLDSAASRIAGSDTSLARIAAEAGFADQSHFTRAFKRHTGVTPARYRRLMRRE
jgi:AraC family transcriptional regulator